MLRIKLFQKKSFLIFLLFIGLIISNYSCNNDNKDNIKNFSKNFSYYVDTLASDEFEGRAPLSSGGEKTTAFIEKEYRRMGLKPIKGDSYRQNVPLIEITAGDFSELYFKDREENTLLSCKYGDEMVVGTTRLKDRIELVNSELVFAGYGIVAPEYNWNDYEGVDVEGKTVVVLVNDPGYFSGDENLFTGKAMTYYGRWTYKFEEASRQGALAVLIVHETGPAGYGWGVVRNSWSGSQYELGGINNKPSVEVQGWIHENAGRALFEKAGFSLQEAKEKASVPGFKPFSLGLSVSLNFKLDFRESDSYNIVGYIKGSKRPEEAVIYMAHWDHLGKVNTPDGIMIYNGATDNATGTAAIMAIAEKFAGLKHAPERSVIFIAVTAEEYGLLGSQYYAQNPLFPLEKTAGGINIDALNVYGPTHDVSVVGYNTTELHDYLIRHAEAQNRIVIPEKYPERGGFYRSDHFNLVRVGVPMIYANSGEDFIGRDEDYVKMIIKDRQERYHSTNDVIHDLWDWKGLDQNLWLFYNVGKELANNKDWPGWKSDSEFKSVREKSENLRIKP